MNITVRTHVPGSELAVVVDVHRDVAVRAGAIPRTRSRRDWLVVIDWEHAIQSMRTLGTDVKLDQKETTRACMELSRPLASFVRGRPRPDARWGRDDRFRLLLVKFVAQAILDAAVRMCLHLLLQHGNHRAQARCDLIQSGRVGSHSERWADRRCRMPGRADRGRPPFGDQQLSLRTLEKKFVTDVVGGKIDPVDHVGELHCQPHAPPPGNPRALSRLQTRIDDSPLLFRHLKASSWSYAPKRTRPFAAQRRSNPRTNSVFALKC